MIIKIINCSDLPVHHTFLRLSIFKLHLITVDGLLESNGQKFSQFILWHRPKPLCYIVLAKPGILSSILQQSIQCNIIELKNEELHLWYLTLSPCPVFVD